MEETQEINMLELVKVLSVLLRTSSLGPRWQEALCTKDTSHEGSCPMHQGGILETHDDVPHMGREQLYVEEH